MTTAIKFLPLSDAETTLCEACESGKWANLDDLRPSSKNKKNHIRAAYIRFLALGGEGQTTVHHRGIQVTGGYITGSLDLTNATVNCSIILKNCYFEEKPVFVHTNMAGLLSLRGSMVPGLNAQGLRSRSSMVLDKGFESNGSVLLKKAHIEGDLDLDGSKFFACVDEYAINAEDIFIKRNCKLGLAFRASGQVSFSGAKVMGDFDCKDGDFNSKNHFIENYSLICDGIEVNGSIFLTGEFHAIGIVSFPAGRVEKGLYVLSKKPISFLDISNLSVGFLVDKLDSWGQNLKLNGFVYKSIRASSTTNATRLAWLKKQSAIDYGEKFKKHEFAPQPWIQIIEVLRNTGHDREATRIMIEYQKHLYKIGKVSGVFFKRPLHFLYGKLTGYGYRPHKVVVALVFTWITFGFLYWDAALSGVFSPTNPLIFESVSYKNCRPIDEKGSFNITSASKNIGTDNWYTCGELKGEYTTFSPFAYSLDIVLPLIDLQQEKDWAPFIDTPKTNRMDEFVHWSKNHFVRLAIWVEILLGWVFSLLLVAQLSGLIRANKE